MKKKLTVKKRLLLLASLAMAFVMVSPTPVAQAVEIQPMFWCGFLPVHCR